MQRTGQKRVRENNEDSLNVPAATRVRQHDGRACAGDFDEYTQEILGTAVTLYRCKATKYGAFPDPLQQAAWSKEQWNQSCAINELQVKSTPEALRIVSPFSIVFLVCANNLIFLILDHSSWLPTSR